MRTAGACMLLAALLLPGHGSAAQTAAIAASQAAIVVSGFEPFGGRTQNASWVLAEEMGRAFSAEVRTVQVPVVWGAPQRVIEGVQPLPKVWIAFGEGTAEFQVEILARNERGMHPDNEGKQPAEAEIVSAGAAVLQQRAQLAGLATALTRAGFPTRVSQNAGRYLCEEMLYSLLHAQRRHPEGLELVLFIHVPVLDSSVAVKPSAGGPAVQQKVDAVWLRAFGRELFATLRALGLMPATRTQPAQ